MCQPKKVYNAVKDSPNYRPDFERVSGGMRKVNVNNKSLLSELNQYGKGWKKVYVDGYLGSQRASLHYFQNTAGKVFDVKYKYYWSVLNK
jgi:hypothetical protein